MKNRSVYRTVVVQLVRLVRCADSMVIKAIRSTMSTMSGIHLPVSIVHVDGIIVLSVKVFNVNINFVWKMKFKRRVQTPVAFRVEHRNNVPISSRFYR